MIFRLRATLAHRIQLGTSRCGTYTSSRGTGLRTSVLQYYCFNVLQQKLVATLLLLPCNPQIKS